MKLTAYKEILKMAKEKVQEALAPVRANEMKKRAELEMAKIDSKMVEQESKISTVASEYPINFDKLIDSIDELALLERRKKQFANIINEMFP
jgi:hypothetical protein